MAKKKAIRTPAKAKRASRIAATFELEGVALVEGACKRGGLKSEALPTKTSVTVQIETKHLESENLIVATPQLNLTAFYEDDPENPIILLSGKFMLRYRSQAVVKVATADLEAFGELTVAFNVWPYWREFVQSMTTRMGLPPLTLPFFRVSQLTKYPSSGAKQKLAAKRKAATAKKKSTKGRVGRAKRLPRG